VCSAWNSDVREAASMTVGVCDEQRQPEKREPGGSNEAVPPVPSEDVLRTVVGCVPGGSSCVPSAQG